MFHAQTMANVSWGNLGPGDARRQMWTTRTSGKSCCWPQTPSSSRCRCRLKVLGTSRPGVRLCLMRNVYPANESAQLLPATDRDEGPEHHLRIAKARHWGRMLHPHDALRRRRPRAGWLSGLHLG